MRRQAAIFVCLLGLTGCEESTQPATAQPPEPVAPVEVATAQVAQPATDEVAQLRARVAELEQQLAACRGQAPSAQTPAVPPTVPEGVDVPAQPAAVTPTPAGTTTPAPATNPADAGPRTRRRRDEDPSLLDSILGTDSRRHGDERTIEIPLP